MGIGDWDFNSIISELRIILNSLICKSSKVGEVFNLKSL